MPARASLNFFAVTTTVSTPLDVSVDWAIAGAAPLRMAAVAAVARSVERNIFEIPLEPAASCAMRKARTNQVVSGYRRGQIRFRGPAPSVN
jgi:hypothetical protein